MKFINYYYIIAISLLPILCCAQSGTTSSGHTVSNSNYQVGYTIGENIISTYTDNQVSLSNGIIQPINGIIISTNDLSENNISVFPNPTATVLNIESEDQDLKSFEIFSLDGKSVDSGLINEASIDVSAIRNGMYILRLKSTEKTFSTLINKINI